MDKKIQVLYFFIDIYNSRQLFKNNQKEAYKLLKSLSKYLNKKFTTKLLSNFDIREGDGILGGTKDLSLLVDIYERCLSFMDSKDFESLEFNINKNELHFYFGVGIGDISTPPSTLHSHHTINGTAISNAKEASDIAKAIVKYNNTKDKHSIKHDINKKVNFFYKFQNFHIYIQTDDQSDKLLNPSFYLAYNKLISNYKQNKLFQTKKKYPDLELFLLGELLGYELDPSPKGRQKLSTKISNLLNKSNYKEQQILLRDITIFLDEKTQEGTV